MDIRALRYLVSLAEHRSFTAAASANFITQPAVSISLKKLQDELGTRLFDLQGRRITFTRAGEVVLEYARRIMSLERELYQEIKDLTGLTKGRISLGTIDAASVYVLPEIFSRFHGLYPGIDIQLEIDSTVPLLRKLESGLVDCVVGTLPPGEPPGLEVYPIFRESLAIIAPPDHPLAARRSVSTSMLADFTFISFHEESITRSIIETVLRERGVMPRITMAIDSPEAIKNLVASGLGLAILPLEIVRGEIERGSVAALRVKGLAFERRLGLFLYAGRYLSSTVRAFLGVLEDGLDAGLPRRLYIPSPSM
ncbi:MAG: LysR family transcriptional regulator [bacterium]|nr:MAG: LysR family transcriptional regulator [bacterium]